MGIRYENSRCSTYIVHCSCRQFYWCGQTVAVAAVGANSLIIALIVNLFVGIALGTNVVIANAIGRDDKEKVKKAVHTSVLVAVIGGNFSQYWRH